MNIENYKPIENLTFKQIYDLQREIKFLYEPESVEIFKNFDLDTLEDQETFKRYSWRIVEELTEALDAKEKKEGDHVSEELIDGLNFLMELYHLVGIPFEHLDQNRIFILDHFFWSEGRKTNLIEALILQFIKKLGMVANLLKNRTWRNSQYLVDLHVFNREFLILWVYYFKILATAGMSYKSVKDLWSLKYQVNLFRIESNY